MATTAARSKTHTSEIPQFVSRIRAAELLAENPQTIDAIIKRGELRAFHVGRCVRLRLDEVARWLEAQHANR